MQDIRVSRAFPSVPEELQHAALLGELLDLDRKTELSRQSIERVGSDDARLAELVAETGADHQVLDAQKTIQASLVELIGQVSERGLSDALEAGLLTVEDHAEIVRLKRVMELEKGREDGRGQDFERE